MLPPIFLLFLFADSLVIMVLGENWRLVIPLIRIMSIFGLSSAFGEGLFDSVVFASGRPQIVTLMNSFRLIVFPACVVVGSFWDITGVAWGFAAFGLMGRMFSQYLLHHFFHFSFFRYFLEIGPPLLCALPASAASWMLYPGYEASNGLFLNTMMTLTGFLVWLGVYGICAMLIVPDKVNFLVEQFTSRALSRLRASRQARI
jgi:O-antigen/teichoic acid export membrane protein